MGPPSAPYLTNESIRCIMLTYIRKKEVREPCQNPVPGRYIRKSCLPR